MAAALVAGAAHAQPAADAHRSAPPSVHAGPPPVRAGSPRAFNGDRGGPGRPQAPAGGYPHGVRPGGFDPARRFDQPGSPGRRFGDEGNARFGGPARRFDPPGSTGRPVGDDGTARFGGPARTPETAPAAGPRVYRFGADRRGPGGNFTTTAPTADTRGGYEGRRGFAGPGGFDRRGPGQGGVGRRNSGGGFDYRGRDHARFHVSPYRFPRGFRYRAYRQGEFFPRGLLIAPYFLDDYSAFYLSAPPGPDYRWVRYGPDALLVDVDTGEVVDEAYGVFDDGQTYGSGDYPGADRARPAYGDAWDGNAYDAPPAYGGGREDDAAPGYGPDDPYPREN